MALLFVTLVRLTLTQPCSHQSEVTEMEMECFHRRNPSVTLATGIVG